MERRRPKYHCAKGQTVTLNFHGLRIEALDGLPTDCRACKRPGVFYNVDQIRVGRLVGYLTGQCFFCQASFFAEAKGDE